MLKLFIRKNKMASSHSAMTSSTSTSTITDKLKNPKSTNQDSEETEKLQNAKEPEEEWEVVSPDEKSENIKKINTKPKKWIVIPNDIEVQLKKAKIKIETLKNELEQTKKELRVQKDETETLKATLAQKEKELKEQTQKTQRMPSYSEYRRIGMTKEKENIKGNSIPRSDNPSWRNKR
jgi:peptidoglycan hydrolase CwlO-like protein